jgi:hypothetical protein
MGEWINVKDRMPESGKFVLTFLDRSGDDSPNESPYALLMWVECWVSGGERITAWRDGSGDSCQDYKVTHWKSLEPPQ